MQKIPPLNHTFLIALTLPFILFLVSPLTFFLENAVEYVANVSDISPLLLLICAGMTGLLFGLLLLLSRWVSLYTLLSGLLVGLALAVWAQSQLFISDVGLLDGHPIDWVQRRMQIRTELLAWFFIAGFAVFVSYRSKRALFITAQGIIFLGGLTILSTWMRSDYQAHQGVESAEIKAFSFHKTQNKIVIVLDMFQSDVFVEMMQRWPQEVAFLRGFTFYPNTVGGYPTTKVSLPLIMSGKLYKNQTPVRPWIIANNATHSIANYYVDKGFGVGLVSIVAHLLEGGKSQPVALTYFSDKTWMGMNRQSLIVLDGGLFRSVPTRLKPKIYDENNWFLSRFATNPSLPPGFPGYDLAFLRAFEKKTNLNSKHIGEFKVYHYAAAHAPYRMNEHYEYEHMPNTRASYVRQARGVMILLRRKLERLRQLGIYDSAQILVIGDHGRGYLPTDLRGAVVNQALNQFVLGGARPLFLYKPSGSVAPLASSDRALHLADVVCVLSNADKAFDCHDYQLSAVDNKRKRTFIYYFGALDFWNRAYMPPMNEYVVDGDVRDPAAWKYLHTEYLFGTVKKTSPVEAS
ncbi:MAG: hypothetical protein NTW08_10315 [Gammaproteobacteria bacterium]|nr:hypothetical protein [Gammaproteobacteria bacterium]